MPDVEMQVNAEFVFMLAIRSAMAPPQPSWTALPPLAVMACHAAVWSKWEYNDAGSGTEFAWICDLVVGAINVPVLATIAARPTLKRFCTPIRAGFSAKVRPFCGVFKTIGR